MYTKINKFCVTMFRTNYYRPKKLAVLIYIKKTFIMFIKSLLILIFLHLKILLVV